MTVVRALCRLKSSGSAFRDLIYSQFHDLGYRPSIGGSDVWMRPSGNPSGFMYCDCVICYVDGVLCIIYEPLCAMKGIQERLKMNI